MNAQDDYNFERESGEPPGGFPDERQGLLQEAAELRELVMKWHSLTPNGRSDVWVPQAYVLSLVDELTAQVPAQEERLDMDPWPQGHMPDGLTVNGHLFAHVAACPCPRIQDEVARLSEAHHD